MNILVEILPDSVLKRITVTTKNSTGILMLNQDITEMLKAAYEAGKNNEELTTDTKLS